METTHPAPPRWWCDPRWTLIPWTCPCCATVTPSTPEINTPCRVCGFTERGD